MRVAMLESCPQDALLNLLSLLDVQVLLRAHLVDTSLNNCFCVTVSVSLSLLPRPLLLFASVPHCVCVSLFLAASLSHCLCVLLPLCVTASLSHCVCASLSHCVCYYDLCFSLSLFITASLPMLLAGSGSRFLGAHTTPCMRLLWCCAAVVMLTSSVIIRWIPNSRSSLILPPAALCSR